MPRGLPDGESLNGWGRVPAEDTCARLHASVKSSEHIRMTGLRIFQGYEPYIGASLPVHLVCGHQ